jgi:DNA-binding SARP family transcriptional activator
MRGLPGQETVMATGHLHASTARYKVHFFGPFRVIRDNQPLGEPVWRRNKAKALLKWFLLNAGRRFSADQLIQSFWPDTPKVSAERNFHVAIHYLRHLLEPDLLPRQESSFIRRNKNNVYWFELNETWWADIFAVHYHYTAAREAEQRRQPAEAIAHYRQVAEYCSLGFLHEDAYEDIFSTHRRHYECIYTEVLERLMQLYAHTNEIEEVLAYAHRALLVDPYCEAAIKAIAHAYFLQGNATGAIRKLDDFQAFLKEDLGIEPGAEILSLRKRIAGRE